MAALLVLVIAVSACGSDADVATRRQSTSTTDETVERAWRPIASAPVTFGVGVTTTWTGEALVVWGGLGSTDAASPGAMYTPADDRWTMLPAAPIAPRMGHVMIWTGREVVIWGGQTEQQGGVSADGAAYDPATDSWRTLPTPPIDGRTFAEAAWTGIDVVIWGGVPTCCPTDSVIHSPEAIAYDPSADTWRSLANVPEPWSGDDGESVTAAVDRDVLVWRRGHLGVHDAATDAWSELPTPPELPPSNTYSTAGPYVIGGIVDAELLLWVGEWTDPFRGIAYDVGSKSWRRIADLDANEDKQAPSAPVFAAGGGAVTAIDVDGGRLRVHTYDVDSDAWTELPSPPLTSRYGPAVANTRRGILVWGGYGPDGKGVSDGALYAAVDDGS